MQMIAVGMTSVWLLKVPEFVLSLCVGGSGGVAARSVCHNCEGAVEVWLHGLCAIIV